MKKNYDIPDILVEQMQQADVLFASVTNPNLNDIYGDNDWTISGDNPLGN